MRAATLGLGEEEPADDERQGDDGDVRPPPTAAGMSAHRAVKPYGWRALGAGASADHTESGIGRRRSSVIG